VIERGSNNFDFMRFVAASFVIFTHSYTVLNLSPEYDILHIISNGKTALSELGVHTFFILSGYLIYQSFVYSKSNTEYFIKRSLRIFPALIVVITFCTFVLGPAVSSLNFAQYFSETGVLWEYFSGIFIFPISYLLPGVFTTHPNTNVNISLWTIPYEFTCYLLVPIIIGLAKLIKINSKYAVGAFILAMSLVGAWFYITGKRNFGVPLLNLSFIKSIHLVLYFFLGALLYELKFLVRKNINPFLILGLTAVYLISLSIPKINLFSEFVFLPLIVLNLSFIKGRLNHFGKYGDFSYGIYLYGFIIQQMVVYFNITSSPIILFLISYPVAIVAGVLSWHLIEKKALSYKKWLKPKQATTVS
jgi:peptidoglycan/LPS O-acetylase OafA/YrhL